MAAADIATEVVSHTAGHRFAPTLIEMPAGNSWAFVDLELAKRIANHQIQADDYKVNYRGWWGAKAGAEQIAVREFKLHNNDDIAQVIKDETITIETISGSKFSYSFTESGQETIPQCQIEDGGTLKFRKLYSVEALPN